MDFEPSDTVAFVSWLRMLRTFALLFAAQEKLLKHSDVSRYLFLNISTPISFYIFSEKKPSMPCQVT